MRGPDRRPRGARLGAVLAVSWRRGGGDPDNDNGWQKALDAVHERYEATGVAQVTRTGPLFRLLRRQSNGTFTGVLLDKGPPDYLVASGPFVFRAEAKNTNRPRLPLSMLEDHQAGSLDRWEEQDPRNVGLLLLRMFPARLAWAVLWRDVRLYWWRWHDGPTPTPTGTASLTPATLDSIGIPISPAAPDWLDRVRLDLASECTTGQRR